MAEIERDISAAKSSTAVADEKPVVAEAYPQPKVAFIFLSLHRSLLWRVVRMYNRPGQRETAEEDGALLAGIAQENPGALTALFDKYSRVVYSVSLRILKDPSAAEDVVQEIFMQVWRKPSAFSIDRGSLAGWLAILSRNRSIDLQRRRRPTDSVDDVVLASNFDLAATAEKNILLARARDWINQLPAEQQQTLHMAFFDGLTHSEIAEKTGSPLGTIKTRIRRALQTLRKAAEA